MQNRIKQLRTQKNVTQVELAKYLGVAQNTLSYWEKGTYDIDSESLLRIADYFGVSTDYILVRKPDKFTDSNLVKSPRKNGIKIPVIGTVPAGVPLEAIEDILDYEEIDPDMTRDGSEYVALQIKGDSMEPRMTTGDVVIVRIQPDAETGDIVVAMVNGDEATVKKLKKRPEGILLIPSNPKYEPMFYTNEDIENLPIRILGRVVELRAKF